MVKIHILDPTEVYIPVPGPYSPLLVRGPAEFSADSCYVAAFDPNPQEYFDYGVVVVQYGYATRVSNYTQEYVAALPMGLSICFILAMIYAKFKF